jgi:hypothetical protein
MAHEELYTLLEPYLPIHSRLIAEMGYDLFLCPDFWECIVCHQFNLIRSIPTTKWDATTQQGVRVEIKFSGAHDQCYAVRRTSNYVFRWRHLHGRSDQGKPVAYYVLIGYNHLKSVAPTSFCLLGIHAPVLSDRTRLNMSVDIRRGSIWEGYQKTFDQIQEDLDALGGTVPLGLGREQEWIQTKMKV